MKRQTYIENNDIKAFDGYISALGLKEAEGEIIRTEDALNRVTKSAVYAKFCDPVYNAAAMDGIAVVAKRTFDATEQTPLTLELDKDFVFVNTGNAIEGDYDAVIMIEDVLILNDTKVSVIAPAYPWQHVRVKGESIVAGEIVLPRGRRIRPVDIGALIASGNVEIEVVRKPRVGIIPTGGEMTDNPDELRTGKLMESNSKMFAALTEELGGIPRRYPVAEDDISGLKHAISAAVKENDIVIVNAGSSAGTKDYAVHAINELGHVYLHGFAIKPGKPTILGEVEGKPVVGIPGYPVSAYLVYETFVRPLVTLAAGGSAHPDPQAFAVLTRKIMSSFKNAELIRMSVGEVDGRLVTTPLERGAAQIMSLVKADALLYVERLKEGIESGETVRLELKKPLEQIKKMLVVTGSHDMILDVLQDEMPITSAHVGSMGGIFAMQRGECHIAPIHLLDEETGEYNVPQIKKYFAGKKMALIRGVGRTQGFIVERGNPKNIKDFDDLTKNGVRFANRQHGSGTRLLLDFKLKQCGIDKSRINGYEKEYNTHLAVAVAVENQVADAGLGVMSAASNMNMDFIPVASESYDFLTSAERLGDARVQRFIQLIKSENFKRSLDALGGYTYDNIGDITIIE